MSSPSFVMVLGLILGLMAAKIRTHQFLHALKVQSQKLSAQQPSYSAKQTLK